MGERPLSDDELDAIEAYCAAATEGPWAVSKCGVKAIRSHPDEDYEVCPPPIFYKADALFVARARTDLPRLVRELRAARQALKRIAKVSIYRNPRTGERPYCTYCGFYEPEHKDDCVVAIARAQVPEVKG